MFEKLCQSRKNRINIKTNHSIGQKTRGHNLPKRKWFVSSLDLSAGQVAKFELIWKKKKDFSKFSEWKMLQCLAAKKVETDSKFRNIVDIPKFKLPQRKFRISVPVCRGRCRIFYFEKKIDSYNYLKKKWTKSHRRGRRLKLVYIQFIFGLQVWCRSKMTTGFKRYVRFFSLSQDQNYISGF